LRNRCGLGLNRNPPFLDGQFLKNRRSKLESQRANSNQRIMAPQEQDKGLNAKNNDLSRIDLVRELS
jgi:hypothetical protein